MTEIKVAMPEPPAQPAELPENAKVYFDWGAPAFKQRVRFAAGCAAGAAAVVWVQAFGLSLEEYLGSDLKSFSLFPALLALLTVHELIHAAFARFVSHADRVWLQGWRNGAVVVRSSGLVPRNRYVIELLAPLVVLSALLPALVAVWCPSLGWLFGAMAVGNALMSGGDLVLAHATLSGCPSSALVDGRANELYFVPAK